jgi:hypothetical protein
MKKTFIYGLVEAGSTVIRYVGKSDNPKTRKTEHIREAKKNKKTHKCYWINNVIENGSKIDFIILEEVDINKWEEREIYWIDKYRNTLTNICSGGIGGVSKTIFSLSYDELKSIIKRKYPFIKTRAEYCSFFKGEEKPNEIPYDPYQLYIKNGTWVSWGDFLDTKSVSPVKLSNKYLLYNEAKKWVNNNLPDIKSAYDWVEYNKNNILPEFIPKKPDRVYKKELGYFRFKDFLNSNNIKKRNNINKYLTYEEAKEYIKNNFNNIKSVTDWRNTYKLKKPNIPVNALQYYKKTNEWVSWVDFLNLNKISCTNQHKNYVNYYEASQFVKSITPKIKNYSDWMSHINKHEIPVYIPKYPKTTYKSLWISWGEFLN